MDESLTIPADVAMVPVARRGVAALLAGFARHRPAPRVFHPRGAGRY